MKSFKEVRALAWQAEFDQVETTIGGRLRARERAYQAALHRAAGAATGRSSKAVDAAEVLARMPTIPLTRHAAHRLKERGISIDQVALVTSFGQSQRVHGATRFALDKRSRQLLAETVPPQYLRRFKTLDILAVVSDDGALVTAAHRTERLRRKVTHH
jgi:hypothetical protein